MTPWKDRALAAEQKLADSKRELETFYSQVNNDDAIAALRRLKALLGVESRQREAPPESLTVVVNYQLEQRPRW